MTTSSNEREDSLKENAIKLQAALLRGRIQGHIDKAGSNATSVIVDAHDICKEAAGVAKSHFRLQGWTVTDTKERGKARLQLSRR